MLLTNLIGQLLFFMPKKSQKFSYFERKRGYTSILWCIFFDKTRPQYLCVIISMIWYITRVIITWYIYYDILGNSTLTKFEMNDQENQLEQVEKPDHPTLLLPSPQPTRRQSFPSHNGHRCHNSKHILQNKIKLQIKNKKKGVYTQKQKDKRNASQRAHRLKKEWKANNNLNK